MDDALQRYIQRALELADERREALDEEDLAEIARDLGLTDEDLARVEQAIADHLDRGRGYSDHGMWDDAIRELEEASAIAPMRDEIRLALAEALTQRWDATDFPDDKRRAEELVRVVIDRQPSNQQAYALLARLNPDSAPPPPAPATSPSQASASPRRATLLIVAALAVVSLGAAAGMIVMIMPSSEPVVVERVVPNIEVPPDAVETGDIDLPIEVAPADGLAFKSLKSRLARYPQKAFYTLWGEFEVTADAEVEEIEVRVRLLGESGAVLTHEVTKAWGSHEATLRKGDRAVFTMLVETNRDARSVALEVVRAEQQSAKGPYARAAVVTPRVEVEVADHLQLEIRERNVSFSPMMNGPKGFFEATWEFENMGEVPIRELTYTVTILGADGAQLATKKKLATYSSHPPIKPGEIALQSTIEMIDHKHKSYEITIIELE